MSAIASLEPRIVWEIFDAITQVPRPSKKEGRIIDFLIGFAEKHGIECHKDATGNVLMRRPATPGCESLPPVVVQAHMDMVCEKRSDLDFDFEHEPIRTRVDGEWVRAEGTTLGADDGIGMAAALAVLVDPTVEHGPVEALFTVDEETGLTGAFGLEAGLLRGRYLINLDSEDEGELFIGCAGGVDTLATFRYGEETAPDGYAWFRLKVGGLLGGHSGDDIDKGRANSNKLAARLLWEGERSCGLRLSRFDGGNLRNAIPREAEVLCGVPAERGEDFAGRARRFAEEMRAEYAYTEPDLAVTIEPVGAPASVIDAATQHNLLHALVGVVNGPVAMSFAMPGLVETSTNLASVKFVEGRRIVVATSQRSSVESAKEYVMRMVESIFTLAGAEVEHSEGYPGWAPDPKSRLLAVTVACYRDRFGVEPRVRAIHAGLECGLFLEKYPGLEMVSFGPTLRGVHSPDERLDIASVTKFWQLLTDVLKRLR